MAEDDIVLPRWTRVWIRLEIERDWAGHGCLQDRRDGILSFSARTGSLTLRFPAVECRFSDAAAAAFFVSSAPIELIAKKNRQIPEE